MPEVRPLHSRIADDLLQKIRDSVFVDQLPIENILAVEYRVSVPTIKKALGLLVDDGVIVRIRGKGTFVNRDETSAAHAGRGPLQAEVPTVSVAGSQGTSVHSEARPVLQVSGNENEEEQPREELREQLRQSKEELKEQPEELAAVKTSRRLGNKLTVVGVILPEAREGFSRRLLSSLLEGLSENGARGVVDFSGGDRERESEIVTSFLHAGVDGLIVFPVDGEIYNKDLVLLSIERFPLVFVDRWFPGIDASRVVSQHANGVKEAVNALHSAGHRNMALVSVTINLPAHTQSVVERTKGFVEGLKVNGIIPTDEALWIRETKADDTFQDAQEYLVTRLRQHPEVTAIVGIASTDVPIALQAARLAGRNVPNDLSIVGFDIGVQFSDIGGLFGERVEDFPVAWIDQSEVVIGKEAAGVVSRLIAGSDKTEVIEVPATFHWGRTCGAAPTTQDVRHPLAEAANSRLR